MVRTLISMLCIMFAIPYVLPLQHSTFGQKSSDLNTDPLQILAISIIHCRKWIKVLPMAKFEFVVGQFGRVLCLTSWLSHYLQCNLGYRSKPLDAMSSPCLMLIILLRAFFVVCEKNKLYFQRYTFRRRCHRGMLQSVTAAATKQQHRIQAIDRSDGPDRLCLPPQYNFTMRDVNTQLDQLTRSL